MKGFLKGLADLVQDQQGGTDEKRVVGIMLVVAAIVYLFTHAPGPDVWIACGGLLCFGLGALGIAVHGDKGPLGGAG